MTLRQTEWNDTDSADRISAFFSDFFLLTAVSGTLAYWITLFTRWPLGTMYPLFLAGMLGGGSIILRSGSRNYQIFPKGRAAYFLYAIAFLCMLVGLFTVRPDGDDLAHFHRALSSAYHLDKAIPLFTTYYDLKNLPELSAPHTLVSYEFFMALWAKSFNIRGIYFIHTVGALLPLFLAPIVYFRLSRSVGFGVFQSCFLALLTFSFIFLSSTSQADWANFTILRSWVGKCFYLLVLLPVLWDVLLRYTRRPDTSNFLRLHATMVASLGLTSSAFFITPYIIVVFFVISILFYGKDRLWLKKILQTSTVFITPAILTLACMSGFFPAMTDYSVWAEPIANWTRTDLHILLFGNPLYGLIAYVSIFFILVVMRGKSFSDLRFFCICAASSSLFFLAPFIFDIIKNIAKSAAWRISYVLPVPFILSIVCIIFIDAIKKKKRGG